MSDVTLRNGTVYKEPQAEKVEDKQESWEDEIGDVLYECCSSPYHDIAFEKIAPIIKSLLETEKKKAVEEVLEYVNKENWHYVDYEKLKAKYKKG